MSDKTIEVRLKQLADYQFEVEFAPPVLPLRCDEPPPLGKSDGPSPVELLSAAVGNCLSDSLLFALRKFKLSPEPLQCTVQAQVGRNPEGRVRVLAMTATLKLGTAAAGLEHLDRVLQQFESFCTVTQSVGAAIPIAVSVVDAEGRMLKS